MRQVLLVLALVAIAVAADAAPRPHWTVYADCAGAYVANARVADPGRPATMVGQMSEVAEDYARAARDAVHHQREVGPRRSRELVARRIEATARRLSSQPREAAERIIDACPQTES